MRERAVMRWLVISVGLSVILTVLLNDGLRAFPAAGQRAARRLATLTSPIADGARTNDRRVRVFIPWTAMILGSLILTILVSMVSWIA